MLFMVIERFKEGGINPVGERFRQSGRMLPDGVVYHASWVEPAGERCFQIMETSHPELLDLWISHWKDLVDFEVIPVLSSNDFWANRQPGKST